MTVGLWVFTGLMVLLTLAASFAVPTWPVAALFVLSLLATLLRRSKVPKAIFILMFVLGLLIIAYVLSGLGLMIYGPHTGAAVYGATNAPTSFG